MVLTNKERQARKHARQKQDPDKYRQILEKDRVRKAKSRAAAKARMSQHNWKAYRAAENARISAYRKGKKEQGGPAQPEGENNIKPYKSAQSMGRAVQKVRTSLPFSPNKKRAVAAVVATEVVVVVVLLQPSKQGRPVLDTTIREKVIEFYLKDDISWQAPGRKDRVIIRTKDKSGKKLKTIYQARYMLMSLREAHDLFCIGNGKVIGITKFCDLRPRYVKLFDSIPHNVCVCSYHENVRLILLTLKPVTNLPDSTSLFTDMIVCSMESKACMIQKCQDCVNKIELFAPSEEALDLLVKYHQWQNLSGEGVDKVEIMASIGDIFAELKRQLNPFLIHSYIKQSQAACMERLKTNVDGKNVLLQVDFSENASLINQNEIQSAHWNHGQATLFTAHAWINSNTSESIVIISDDLDHTKISVHAVMSLILTKIKEKYPTIENMNVFSDGAGAHFKQRFLFSNLFNWEKLFNINLKWNFFATSHGKGVVDGHGGTVKGVIRKLYCF
ncbi:uncharacterized protein [Antedon mediterranea]|uniref:uncharacterized protein n=1 Tax=Antedon mediterranea TaxID=105859 RepID=UPI003AF5C643